MNWLKKILWDYSPLNPNYYKEIGKIIIDEIARKQKKNTTTGYLTGHNGDRKYLYPIGDSETTNNNSSNLPRKEFGDRKYLYTIDNSESIKTDVTNKPAKEYSINSLNNFNERIDKLHNQIERIAKSDCLINKLQKVWFEEKDCSSHFNLLKQKVIDLLKARQSIDITKHNYISMINNYYSNNYNKLLGENKQNAEKQNDLPKIAIVGQFSCGKSSFINSLLGEEIQNIGENPVTHAITEFSYGKKTQILDINGHEYTKSAYKALNNKKIQEFSIKYNSDLLKYVNIIDTPGWDPPSGSITSNDGPLTEKAIEKSDIVFFLMDISDGTIIDNTLIRLKDIQKSQKLYVVLTRVDSCFDFDPEDIESNPVKECIMNSLGLDREKVMFYSSMPECRNESYVMDTRTEIGKIIYHAQKSKTNKALNQKENIEKFVNEYLNFIINGVLKMTISHIDEARRNYNKTDLSNIADKIDDVINLLNYLA